MIVDASRAAETSSRPGLAVVAALVLGAAAFGANRVSSHGLAAERDAPEFQAPVVLNAQAGETELTLSSLRGRAVVLDFWASWCGPCRAEAPILQRLYARYREQGLTVVGVNTSDAAGRAAPTARQLGLQFPIVYDRDESVARAYGVSGLPTLVVVSKSGKVVAIRAGTTSEATLEELVRRALAS